MSSWDRCSPAVFRAATRATAIAARRGGEVIAPAHLLIGILDEIDAQKHKEPASEIIAAEVLTRCGVERHVLRAYIAAFLEGEVTRPVSKPVYSHSATLALSGSYRETARCGRDIIDLEHLLPGLLDRRREPLLAQMVEPLGLTCESARFHLRQIYQTQNALPKNSPLAQLSMGGQRALDDAYAAMRSTHCGRISTLHLLLGVLADEDNLAVETLKQHDVDVDALKRKTRKSVRQDGQLATPQRRFTSGAKRALERARTEARTMGHTFIGPEHVLLSLLSRRASVREMLLFGGEVEEGVKEILSAVEGPKLRAELHEKVGFNGKLIRSTDSKLFHPQSRQLKAFYEFCAPFVWMLISNGVAFGLPRNTVSAGIFILNIWVLFLSGLVTCVFQLMPCSAALKTRWVNIFFGFMLGIMLSYGLMSVVRG